MHQLIENLCHNVQAAQRSAAVKQNSLTGAHEENVADHIQKRVLHNGGRCGREHFQNGQAACKQNDGVNGFESEILAHQDDPRDQ